MQGWFHSERTERTIKMKNGLWLVIVITAVFLGVLSGFTTRSYYTRNHINKVPVQVKIEEFENKVLNKISDEEDKKYINNLYSKGEDNYTLKSDLDVLNEDIIEIYNILKRHSILESIQYLAQQKEVSGCGESAGY